MGDTVCKRLAPVVEAAIDFDGSPQFNFGGQGKGYLPSANGMSFLVTYL